MRVLVIPDLHAPYQHPKALRFLARVQSIYRCNAAVCIGDEIDAHAWSRHEKHPDALGAADELRVARHTLAGLAVLCPRLLVCDSNHTVRHLTASARGGVPSAACRTIAEMLGDPKGWRRARTHCIDGVTYTHGEGLSAATGLRKALQTYASPVVFGHVHSLAGILHSRTPSVASWAMAVGCLIDDSLPVFSYASHHLTRAVLGCGVVLNGVPQWIPMT